MQNVFTNSAKNEMVEKIENTMKEVMDECPSNQSQDDFFNNNGDVIGGATPLAGFEIKIKSETAIAEDRYKFRVQNFDIEKQVETKFGVKDKLVIEFHIWRIRDGSFLFMN